VKQADLKDSVRRPPRVSTSPVVVPPDHLSPTASTSSVVKAPENTKEVYHYIEPVAEIDILLL
jgi:hypothetical protein